MDGSALVSLVNAGGIVTLSLVAVVAFVKGWIVPGFMYDREVKRTETLDGQVDQNIKAIDRLTDEVRSRDRKA